jgi:hypothetical protein
MDNAQFCQIKVGFRNIMLSMLGRTCLAILFGIFAVLLQSLAVAQPDRFFVGDEDFLWLKFLNAPCTLIEGVPIVSRSEVREASPSDAIVSSIIGYYQRDFPILGPPVPSRVDQLVWATSSTYKITNLSQQNELRKALSAVEAKSFANFKDISLKYPSESDGGVRIHFLYSLGRKGPTEKLERIAKEQNQTVFTKTVTEVSYSGIMNTVLAKKLSILNIDQGKFVYLVVGTYQAEELAIVIDPDSARLNVLPAEEVYLTEKDRKSTGSFATQAREILSGQTVAVDEITSCKGKRPAGLRFLHLKNLFSSRTHLQIIQDWQLDKAWLRSFIARQ